MGLRDQAAEGRVGAAKDHQRQRMYSVSMPQDVQLEFGREGEEWWRVRRGCKN